MFTKQTITRKSIDALSKVCPGVTLPATVQSTLYGQGNGTASDPFTWDEYLAYENSGGTGSFDSGWVYYYDMTGNLQGKQVVKILPDVIIVTKTEEERKAEAEMLHRKRMARELAERFALSGITGVLTHIDYNSVSGVSGSQSTGGSGASGSGTSGGLTGAAILGGEDCVMQCLVHIFKELFPRKSTTGLLDKYCQEFWNTFGVNRINTALIPKFLNKYYNTYNIGVNDGDSAKLLKAVDLFKRQEETDGKKYFVILVTPNPKDPSSTIDHAVVLNYVDKANEVLFYTDLKYKITNGNISIYKVINIYGLEYIP